MQSSPLSMLHSGFHLADPEVRRSPYPHYRWLRQQHKIPNLQGFGWLVSRYDDASFVLGHPDLFSSSVMAKADFALLGNDPPEHTRIRGIVNAALTPELLQRLETRIRSTADRIVARAANSREWNLVDDLAIPLPVGTIADLLGIAPDRWPVLRRWSDAIVRRQNGSAPQGFQSADGGDLSECDSFVRDMIEQRSKRNGDDLISELLHGVTAEKSLLPSEVLSLSKLLLVAGSETTTHLIGNAVLALLRSPDELARVKSDPSLIPSAIEETLRYDAPVQFVVRRTTQQLTLSETKLPAGARVLVLLGSANRDESRFSDPDHFNVMREHCRHLAFGAGIHYCLGGTLARLEAEIAIASFLSINSTLIFADDLNDVALVDSIQLRGPKSLRFTRTRPLNLTETGA